VSVLCVVCGVRDIKRHTQSERARERELGGRERERDRRERERACVRMYRAGDKRLRGIALGLRAHRHTFTHA